MLLAVVLPASASAAGASGTSEASPWLKGSPTAPAVPAKVGAWDWPTYGHDAQHTFHGRTTLTEASVTTLRQAWHFSTGDAVTATPTVVGDTVYVGSWDDSFYALNLETGALRWKFRLSSQRAITPYPGQNPRDVTSDGGLVTSAAWFEPAAGRRPALVIFSGGYTLYALEAANGAVYWKHAYPGVPGPLDPNNDGTRIFSSPVVADGRVLFGVDEDGQHPSAGYVAAASLATGDPVWEFQTDVGPAGQVTYDGCGSVWSSGTVLPDLGLVVFGTADCHFASSARYADSVIALHIGNGALAWQYHPLAGAPACDDDFGSSANAGVTSGRTTFLGEGSKDGTYYSLDPRTGRARWSTNVVFGGSSGGFIGTTAYDGARVYGATGLGDFLPRKGGGNTVCDPGDPRDTASQNPSDHAFHVATGAVEWQDNGFASFSPTTVAGGMTFNGPALTAAAVQVRDAATGRLVAQIGLPQANWSGIATVGDALVLGVGSTYDPSSSGIEVLTPSGDPPVVPTKG